MRFKTAGCELKHRFHLLPGEWELLHYFVDGHAIFQILEDGRYGHPCPLEHPSSADLAGNALHGWTLRPIEYGHVEALSDFESTPALGFGSEEFRGDFGRNSKEHKAVEAAWRWVVGTLES